MSLYNDLSAVLTPYANKIKQNTASLNDLQDDLDNLDVETDKTLSVDGKSADAKATGDAINEVKADLDAVKESLGGGNLFDKTDYSIYHAKIQDDTGYIVTADASQEMIIVPVDSNTTYTVEKSIGSHMRVGSGGVDEPPHRYKCTSYVDNYQESDLTKTIVISTGDNDHYLYISMWSNSDPVDKRDATIYIDSLYVSKEIDISDFIDSKQCIELLGRGFEESPRCSYFLDYDGRIDSDGTTIRQSPDNYIQRYSDYIPVLNGEDVIIALSVPYVEGRVTWLAYSVYDQSKNVVVGRTETKVNTVSDGYMYSVARYTVTADGYMRIMGNSYGDGVFALYATSDMNSIQMPRQRFEKEIVEASIEKAIVESGKICASITAQGIDKASRCSYFLDYDGRLDSDGITIYPSTTGSGQRYSDYIPVSAGEKIIMQLRVPYAEGRATWLAYSVYDANKGVIIGRRAVSTNTVSDGYMYSRYTYEVTVDGYMRIMGNSYGDGIFAFYATSNVDEVQIPRQQLKKEIIETSVSKSVKKALPLMRYSTRYDEVCLGINHRGYNTAPENTIPAYAESLKHGFRYVECDIRLTSDGKFILLHDATINRTGRNADGTAISGTINIIDITYDQALAYDFGAYKSSEYAGIKMPLFSEFLSFCRKAGLHPYLELKFAYNEQDTKKVVDMVRDYGMRGKVTYVSATHAFLRTVNAYDPEARIGIITEAPTVESLELAIELKNDKNCVVIHADRDTDEAVNLCRQYGVPMEIWKVTANKATILATNPYITGFSHDYLHAGEVMYEDAMGKD